MPELAEVEYFRRRWDCGMGQRILAVELHADKRLFRGNNLESLVATLRRATLLGSLAHGKQMLFRFSRQGWLGIHLGMTGELRREPAEFAPGKHDHLVLRQRAQCLVFGDARLFGRVLFHRGKAAPPWWSRLPPSLTSGQFTLQAVIDFVQRRARAPIKAVLLMQQRFPGIGNWMADEILWRARIHPAAPAGQLTEAETKMLWKEIRWVCAAALRVVAKDYSDPPTSWLFRHRWEPGGACPRDEASLDRATIGGRTSAWCPECQGRNPPRRQAPIALAQNR